MYAMMQCKAKSENLAHILGYQIWAVIDPQTRTSPPCFPETSLLGFAGST